MTLVKYSCSEMSAHTIADKHAGTLEHSHTHTHTCMHTQLSPSVLPTPGQFLLREMCSVPIDKLELDWFNSSILQKGQSLVSPQQTSKHAGFIKEQMEPLTCTDAFVHRTALLHLCCSGNEKTYLGTDKLTNWTISPNYCT